MKVSRILAPFLVLSILNSSLSTNFILKPSQNDNKLSNYVCKITKDIMNSKTDTQDVLIGNLGGKMWSSTVNDIAGCLGNGNAIVVADLKKPLTEKTLKKATVVILTVDHFDKKSIEKLVGSNHFSTVWHHMANIMLIMSKDITLLPRFKYLEWFLQFGFINVVTVHEAVTQDILFETYYSLDGVPWRKINKFDVQSIFPDKLKNVAGYVYKIIVYRQIPKVVIHNGMPKSPLVHFITMIQKIQNATIRYMVIKDEMELANYWSTRALDLALNTGVKMISTEPKLMTYEESGYCALVPLPPKTPIYQSIIIEPFDGLTWMFFILTMACSVAVWWMFRGRGAVDSPWLLGYGMFVMFIGQGVDFSRQNRMVLTILLQLIIFMIWVLSNAYEGVITSFMIQPIHEHRLETFDDLVASDYEIITDVVFARAVADTGIYNSLVPRLNSSGNQLRDELITEIQRQHFVFIMNCDIAEITIDVTFSNDKKASEFYYLLPQKIFPYLEQLEASYLNPFIERFQYYMDLSFQAGLMHIWKIISPENRAWMSHRELPEDAAYLELKDLEMVFRILMIGCAMSSVLFFFEIFCHGILEKLKLLNLARKLRNRVHQMSYKKKKQPKHPKYQKGALYYIIHRRKRVKRLKAKKLKVRRIYVQPRFPMD